MNKERLLELAGVSSNMSNPSFEPATDVADNKLELPAELQTGDDSDESSDLAASAAKRIKNLALQGADATDVEMAKDLFHQIVNLLGDEDSDDDITDQRSLEDFSYSG